MKQQELEDQMRRLREAEAEKDKVASAERAIIEAEQAKLREAEKAAQDAAKQRMLEVCYIDLILFYISW